MLDLRDTSVVLPTLNERENIHLLINRLNSLYQLGEIIVVDDGSTDGTIFYKSNFFVFFT
jgi:glycosyltransferase involved in cell wall biosynthesis